LVSLTRAARAFARAEGLTPEVAAKLRNKKETAKNEELACFALYGRGNGPLDAVQFVFFKAQKEDRK
jgi:hypothetical protein